ncbi:MAG: zinc-binding dehydrogenase [Polyangiales bacterium]
MRAIRFHSLGGPEVLQYEQVDDPVVSAGKVLVRVRAAGVNFADTRFRMGQYFVRPIFPQVVGMEAAGEVEAVGEGVADVRVGDRVMVLGANAYAEKMLARPSQLYPMPDGLDFERAAALPVQGLTAHHCLALMGRLSKGDSVLVHAAAGGVGVFAVQIARAMGAARVFGTASSEEKRAMVRSLGADDAFDYGNGDYATRVREATSGRGVDVLLEMLGGTETYKRNLACMASMGRMIVYGAASGDTRGTFEPIGLMHKNLTIAGYYLTPMLDRAELCRPALDEVARWVVEGRVRVGVERFALKDAAEAHRRMESRATTGKLVLVVD